VPSAVLWPSAARCATSWWSACSGSLVHSVSGHRSSPPWRCSRWERSWWRSSSAGVVAAATGKPARRPLPPPAASRMLGRVAAEGAGQHGERGQRKAGSDAYSCASTAETPRSVNRSRSPSEATTTPGCPARLNATGCAWSGHHVRGTQVVWRTPGWVLLTVAMAAAPRSPLVSATGCPSWVEPCAAALPP